MQKKMIKEHTGIRKTTENNGSFFYSTTPQKMNFYVCTDVKSDQDVFIYS